MRHTYRRHILFVVCYILVVTSSAVADGSLNKGDYLFILKHSTSEEIACFIQSFRGKKISTNDIKMIASLLDDKDTALTEPSLLQVIQVRDVALACIEAATGETFLPLPEGKVFPTKEIISCRSTTDDQVYRIHFPDLSDDEFREVKAAVEQWASGIKRQSNTQRTSVPRNSADHHVQGQIA
jgi:hypothetical protein